MSASEIKSVLYAMLTQRLGPDRVRELEGSWAAELWAELSGLGLTTIEVPDEVAAQDALEAALTVMESCAFHNANIPIVDSGFVGSWVRAQAGLPQQGGMDGVAICDSASLRVSAVGDIATVSGEAIVPWGRFADQLLILSDAGLGVRLLVIDPVQAQVAMTWTHGTNLAGEPRDKVRFSDTTVASVRHLPISPMQLQARLSLGVTSVMLGALDKIMGLSIEQVRVREQFGKPLSKFQVIQHYIASMSAELATVRAAVNRVLAQSHASGEIDIKSAAAAKVRAGAAVRLIVPLAHQVHGAMGVTEEHELGLSTRRLWAWRDEAGDEQYWARVLGREVASVAYPSSLWSVLEPIE